MVYFYLFVAPFLILIEIIIIVQFYNLIFRGHAPFISTKARVIEKIFSEINFGQDFNGMVYELGAGKAGFLRAFEEKYPATRLIGVEYAFFPFFLAKIQIALAGSKIKMKKANMFKLNLSDADVIYCYLMPTVMKELEPKVSAECRPGTKIVSYQFLFPNLKPERMIDLEKMGKVYVYSI